VVGHEEAWGQNANAGPDVTICSNGQTTLSGSASGGDPPYTFSWFPPVGLSDPSISNPICTVDNSTTYTLTVIDASGNTDTDQVSVTVLPAPAPVLTVADPVQTSTFNGVTTFFICGENSFTFNFTDASTAPANSTYTVNWGNGNNGNPTTTGWTSSQAFSLGMTQGTYTITAPNTCTSILNFSMFVGIAPDGGAVADGNTNVCLGQPINASWTNIGNNPPGTNYILNWGDGTSDTFVHPPPPVVPHTYTTSSCAQAGGQFCVSYEIINPCTPARTGQFCQVLVSEAPVASFAMSADTACTFTNVSFTDNSSGTQAPDCNTPKHIWSISPGTYSLTSGSLGLTNGSNNPNNWTSGSQVLSVQFTAPGTYSITDVVGNNICGRDTLVRTICVEGPPVPNFTLSPLVGCSPLVANSNNTSILNGCHVTRTWEATQITPGCAPQPGSVSFNAQANAPQFTFTGQGTYEVTLTLENTCGEFEQTIAPITVNGPPLIDQAALPILCAGQGCVAPSAVSQDCGSPITGYAWTFPGGTPANSDQQNPGQVCYATPGTYAVTASATNGCGTSQDVIDLVVSTLPVANSGVDATLCEGGSTLLNGSASGGTAPYTFSWSPTTNLNDPGIANPTANPGTTTSYTLTVTDAGGCVGTDQVLVTVTATATANAGGPYAVCAGSSATVTAAASGSGSWTAPPGTGTFLNATSAETSFTPAPGQTGNSITLTWTTNDPDGPGPCPAVGSTATLTVNPPATAVINGPYTACSNTPVSITATTNNSGNWTTNGAGTFANSTEANTTYTPGSGDTSSPVTITWTTIDPDGPGPCTPATASSTITVTPAATANAGGPYTTCGNGAVNITSTGSGTGVWSTTPGAGTFASTTNASTTFTPANATPGNIILTWTTNDPDGPGPCASVSNAATLTVNEPATAATTGPYTACSNAPVSIAASTNSNGIWTTDGAGTFGDNTSANTTYTPGSSEPNDPVTITWTTIDPDGPGPCIPATASSTITINPAATANAGGPYTTCGNGAVSISSTGSGTGVWSTTPGAGTFASTTNASTTFTPASATPGTIDLTWTTNDPDASGPCAAVSNTATLTVNEPATATINGPFTACSNAPVDIAATTNSDGTWTTNGTGTFGNNANASTSYTPGVVEPNNPVTITWTTNDPDGPGPCTPATASSVITVNTAPTVEAGTDLTLCLNGGEVTLGGTPVNGNWSGTGVGPTGAFNPVTVGVFALAYTYTDANDCTTSDSLIVTVNDAAIANANGPYTTCGTAPIPLNASTNGTGQWSGGSGIYADASDPGTTYTPSLAEVGTSIQLTWSTVDPDGAGPCVGAQDNTQLTISEPATALAGGPYDVCSNSSVEVTVSTTPGTGSWTGGSGSFMDTANPTTTYTPASTEAGNAVILTWTTIDPDGVGPCPAVTAAVTMNVLAAASAEANGPYVTCGPEPVAINAAANGSGSWAGGVGTFGDAQNVSTTYTADPTEFGNTITLTWTTNDPDGPGPCPDAADTADLLIHTLPVADAGLDLTLACGDAITGTATAGAGPDYTYSWSPTTGLISPNTAVTPVTTSGTYTLLVTDANGCSGADSVQVTVTGLESMAQTSDVEVCLFDAVDLQGNATDGLAPHTFTWTPADYLTPPTGIGATVSFSYALPLTQDTVFAQVLRVVDAFGCADTDTLSVTVHPLPVVVVGADTSLCAYDLPFGLSGDPLGGTWDPASTVDPAVLVFGNNPFVYSYTDANNCTNTDELIVTVNEVPQADFTSPDTACVNTSVLFTNQSSCPTCSNIDYAWDFGDGSPGSSAVSPQHSYLDTGLYVVRLIAGSGFGCSDTITRPIRIIKVPEVGLSFTPDQGCGPLEVDLVNTSQGLPINHLWNIETFGTSTLVDPGPITFPVAPCDSTFYTIALTASNQCGSVTAVDSVKVYAPPQPLLVVSADTVCSPFNLEAYNETTCAWATTYAWDFGDDTGSNTQDLLVSHIYTADSVPVTYTLTLTAQNVCGTVAATNSILVYPNTVTAFFNTAPLVGCPPLPVQFTQSLLGITFWTWNFGDGNTSQDADPLYIYAAEGTYEVSLIVSNGCAADTMTQQVQVLSPPTFDFIAEPDTLCVLQPTTFTPSGNNTTGWTWDFGDDSTSTLTSPTHAYAAAGEYPVSLTAFSTTTGCPATVVHPVQVLVTPVASVLADPSQGCTPLRVQFGNNSTDASFFNWDFGDGNTSADPAPENLYQGAGTYTAQVIGSNLNGCADTTHVVITVFPVPIASFTYTRETPLEPILPVAFENLSEGATGYQWSFGDGGTSTFVHPDHVYQVGGECQYLPSLIAINQYSCTDTVVRDIIVPRNLRIFAPNSFTPDGDGVNDVFVVEGADIDLARSTLTIFDRWGQPVHESRGPVLKWDGRVSGTPAQHGVYVWKVETRQQCDNNEVERMGHVTLVR